MGAVDGLRQTLTNLAQGHPEVWQRLAGKDQLLSKVLRAAVVAGDVGMLQECFNLASGMEARASLEHVYRSSPANERSAIVHRLQRNMAALIATAGAAISAKTLFTHSKASDEFHGWILRAARELDDLPEADPKTPESSASWVTGTTPKSSSGPPVLGTAPTRCPSTAPSSGRVLVARRHASPAWLPAACSARAGPAGQRLSGGPLPLLHARWSREFGSGSRNRASSF